MKNHRNELTRTNSICPTPEELLLEYVRKNQHGKIELLVQSNRNLLTAEYDFPFYKPILYIACSEDGIDSSTVQYLLDLGADPCQESDNEEEAIHIAARCTRSDHLNILTRILSKEQVNHLSGGNTALLTLIKQGDWSKKNEFISCAQVLINSEIDVNKSDNKNITAILIAIRQNYNEIVQLLLNNCKDIDIDSKKLDGKSARELILDNSLYDQPLPDFPTKRNADPKDELFNLLKCRDEIGFINYNKDEIVEYKDTDNFSHTLLQLSCQMGLDKAVAHLLTLGADPKRTTFKTKKTPLELASEKGYYRIVEYLLDRDKYLSVSSKVISHILKNINNAEYGKCYNKLLSNHSCDCVNSEDEFDQTPLHFAVHYGKSEHIHALLRKGASLASKNQFDIMPIQDIDADILEQHLNECIDINGARKENMSVTFNYKTILPPPMKSTSVSSEGTNLEQGFKWKQNPVAESEAIAYLCKAPHLRHLLTHPIIVSFLLLKWHKVRWLFYANITLYVIFFLSLLTYVFSSYGYFHYINTQPALLTISTIAYCSLCITYLILIMRELFQLIVAPCKYLKNFENYIEFILIILVGAILFSKDPSIDTRKQLSSVAILLSAFELILMMGQHPKLSTNVVMLKTVSFNFFKFLSWYFLLILAFALSFFILFSEPVEESDAKKEEEDENLFVNPGSSLFKTVVMLTGEFDASSINFNAFPITSKIIFILFVLMIAITLLNLLNGLAVSDTQMIKHDAEYVGLIARTEHVFYIESMIMGDFFPATLAKLIQNLCCCLPLPEHFSFRVNKPLANYVCIYPTTEISICLDKPKHIYEVDDKINPKTGSIFTSLSFERELIVRTRKIIHDKEILRDQNSLERKIRKIVLNVLSEFGVDNNGTSVCQKARDE